MATAVHRVDNHDEVAHRFFGGVVRGPMVQMEVTQFEFESMRNVIVVEETSDVPMTFGEWFDSMVEAGRTVEWDNAHRQNEMARAFENHRFAEMMTKEAQQCRTRARECVRQTMRNGV